MIIDANNIARARCPMMNGLVCMGASCAVWRALDAERGYCGAGGAAAIESAQGDGGRVPRRNMKGAAEQVRR